MSTRVFVEVCSGNWRWFRVPAMIPKAEGWSQVQFGGFWRDTAIAPPPKKMVDRILMADWTINLIQFSHAFCTITIPRFEDGHATINMELSIKQIHGHPIVVDWPTDTYTMFWPANRTEPDSRSWDRNSEVIKPYGSSTSLNLVVTNHIVKPCGWKMHPLYYIYIYVYMWAII